MRLFSYRQRPVHLGPYPLERLTRAPLAAAEVADLAGVPLTAPMAFDAADPLSLAHAMQRFMAMFDVIRDGAVAPLRAEIPDDPLQRAQHLKAAGYYFDASMMGVAALQPDGWLQQPHRNPDVAPLVAELQHSQPRSFAAGLDMILADVMDSASKPQGPVHALAQSPELAHTQALVILVEYPREPAAGEPGCEWIAGTQAQRAAVLAAQTAVMLASYLRLLGFEARSHTATCSELCLNRAAVAAGLVQADLQSPYLGARYGLAAVSTNCALAADMPLAPAAQQKRRRSHGLAWQLGLGTLKGAHHQDPFASREFHLGPHPYETIPRRDQPSTFIDHERVPRFPKRADFFARALFGDLGADVQESAKNAHYVMKSPIGACARRALGALLLLQFGGARGPVHASTLDPAQNALRLKATAYYLGADAVGLCAVPKWAWYSHDAGGNELPTYHANAVNLLIDQGHETMEGASGDDWISVAQSMRAYLRFSLLGGIVAEQIRRLGYSARVHSVLDGDVLLPPLLLLSGLGEVSRIGEVILNPFLGPRLKSGSVTTDMPMQADRPIDFGLQRFCESCNKCARECPSGAISAGPKVVYNGYEIWKSDAEKCARYRITNSGGGMCGRCMKTCPWNLEGLLADSVWRWAAMHLPSQARTLARLDDQLGRGRINPVKKWWWDIELQKAAGPNQGRYVRAAQTHARDIQPELKINPAEQSLAVYPADTMPAPWPVTQPVNREQGIARYQTLLSPQQYRRRLACGDTEGLAPPFAMPAGEPPVFPLTLLARQDMTSDVARYELVAPDGGALPAFEAGAHVDVVIAPEYQRPYSLAGDPADRSRYVLGVQREAGGRGGSALMHRAFRPGRTVFVSRPRNHFELQEDAAHSLLLAGGIGVTPLITMAHRLHALQRSFDLHYSAHSRAQAGFVDELLAMPWHGRVQLHFSDQGQRAELFSLIGPYREGRHLYACGSARYMDAAFAAAQAQGWPEAALHREYFSLPEAPPRQNHAFQLRLLASGRSVPVAADQSATQALAAAGVLVPTKCSDGLCGVCAVDFDAAASGEIDHRDHVLSAAVRTQRVILCCSRPLQPGAVLVLPGL